MRKVSIEDARATAGLIEDIYGMVDGQSAQGNDDGKVSRAELKAGKKLAVKEAKKTMAAAERIRSYAASRYQTSTPSMQQLSAALGTELKQLDKADKGHTRVLTPHALRALSATARSLAEAADEYTKNLVGSSAYDVLGDMS